MAIKSTTSIPPIDDSARPTPIAVSFPMVKIIVVLFLTELVLSLRVLPHHRRSLRNDRLENHKSGNILQRILSDLSTRRLLKSRSTNHENLSKAQHIYKALSKYMPKQQLKKMLRQDEESLEVVIPADPERENVRNEQAVLVEHELIDALTKQSSALLDSPYVEKKGRNDFLVMKPDITDPFVTVIPNAIYYNVEKKCVNWLDDCSLQGIRSRLLNKVMD